MEVSARVNTAVVESVTARMAATQAGFASISGRRAVIGTDLNYAPIVVFGSKPHTIYPKTRKALFWKGAAHPVFSVRHPGTRPNPFVQEGTEASVTEVSNIFAGGVTATINGNPGAMRQALLGAGLAVQANIQRRAPVKTGTLRRSFYTQIV